MTSYSSIISLPSKYVSVAVLVPTVWVAVPAAVLVAVPATVLVAVPACVDVAVVVVVIFIRF